MKLFTFTMAVCTAISILGIISRVWHQIGLILP